MSNPNHVVIDIRGRTDGPGGIKQASQAAQRDLSELREEAEKGGVAAREAGRGQELMAVAMRGVALGAAAAGVAVAAYAAIHVKAAFTYIKSAEALGDLAEKHELTVEQMSVMRLEAEHSNTSLEKIGQGYRQLSVKMLEANSGNQQAISLFRALGIEWEDGSGKLRSVNDVMDDVKDRLSGMERGAGRTGVAAKLLGKGLADELIPWLSMSAAETKKLRTEAEALGLKIDTDTARAAKEFSDNLKVLKLSAEGLGRSLVSDLVESLVNVTGRMREARKEGGLLYTVLEGLRQLTLEGFGVGSPQQQRAGVIGKLDNVQSQIAGAQGRLNQLPEGAAGTHGRRALEGRLRSLRAEEEKLKAERDRLNSVLAVNLGTNAQGEFGTSPAAKAAAPDELLKDGKPGRTGAGRAARDPAAGLRNRLAAESRREYEEQIALEQRLSLAGLARQDALERAATASHDSLQRQAQALRESLDPWAAAAAAVKRYDALLAEGVITTGEHAAAVSQATERAQASMKKFTDEGAEGFNELRNAVEGWGRETSRALAKTALDGRISFETLGQAARNFLEELLAIQIKKRMMEPWLRIGTSFLDNILNPGGRGFGFNASGTGGAFDVSIGGQMRPEFHAGRGPGEFGAPRFVHPAWFENAPRLHAGVGPGEMPAIIREDESVLTPGQMRALGEGRTQNIEVRIVNQGTPQRVQSVQPQFDGRRMVIQIMTEDLRANGPIAQAMGDRFQ